MSRPILAVDLDGILCERRKDKSVSMSVSDCLNAQPIKSAIIKVNVLSRDYFIIIYTARKNKLVSATLDWLNANNIYFDAFSNKKMNADYYIDDKDIKI